MRGYHEKIAYCRFGLSVHFPSIVFSVERRELVVGVKKTGKGRRKIGRKKRRMRARIRHRKK